MNNWKMGLWFSHELIQCVYEKLCKRIGSTVRQWSRKAERSRKTTKISRIEQTTTTKKTGSSGVTKMTINSIWDNGTVGYTKCQRRKGRLQTAVWRRVPRYLPRISGSRSRKQTLMWLITLDHRHPRQEAGPWKWRWFCYRKATMKTSHGMSFHLVWDLTMVRPTNRTCCSPPPPPPLFFFFSLTQLYNNEDQSQHYTLFVLRTLHYCDMVHGRITDQLLHVRACVTHTHYMCAHIYVVIILLCTSIRNN